jgi:hypothetical protein
VNDLCSFIVDTTALHLRVFLRGLNTPYDILQALKKRVGPIQYGYIGVAKDDHVLEKLPKNIAIETWLMKYETTYEKPAKIKLLDVGGHNALWDFLMTIKGIDEPWSNSYRGAIHLGLRRDPDDYLSLIDALKAFRNNSRYCKGVSQSVF